MQQICPSSTVIAACSGQHGRCAAGRQLTVCCVCCSCSAFRTTMDCGLLRRMACANSSGGGSGSRDRKNLRLSLKRRSEEHVPASEREWPADASRYQLLGVAGRGAHAVVSALLTVAADSIIIISSSSICAGCSCRHSSSAGGGHAACLVLCWSALIMSAKLISLLHAGSPCSVPGFWGGRGRGGH